MFLEKRLKKAAFLNEVKRNNVARYWIGAYTAKSRAGARARARLVFTLALNSH